MNIFEKARQFIYRNARPLDLARWQFHFEHGSQEAVLKALAAYQNEDGGFGHALEADSFNPNSCPIQTWTATVILQEIGMTDPSHPIIQGILRYLDSGADFDTEHRQWLNVVPTNNDYPCATWWKYGEKGSEFKYNPTAALAGFILRYAERESMLYQQAREIAKEAVDWLMAHDDAMSDQHVIGCFMSLYESCLDTNTRLFDMNALYQKLSAMLHSCLDGADEKWGKEYCAFPSDYIDSKNSPFYAEHADIVHQACNFIKRQQLPDGSYPVVWQWWTDHKEFEIAANWWKSDITIKYMLFLQEFDSLN